MHILPLIKVVPPPPWGIHLGKEKEGMGKLRGMEEREGILGLKMLLNMVAERDLCPREFQGRRILRASRRHRRLR